MALLLRRKPGQTILINHGIRITVADVSGKNVRLAIETPEGVRVQREEVADRGGPTSLGEG